MELVRKYKNEDFFQILGQISVFFATLDVLTTSVILALVKKEKFSELKPLSDNTTLQQKLLWIKRLNEGCVKNTEALNELKGFIDEAIKVAEERNRYIHDQWLFNPEKIVEGRTTRFKLIGLKNFTCNFEPKDFSLDDFYLFKDEIAKLQIKMGSISDKLGLLKNH